MFLKNKMKNLDNMLLHFTLEKDISRSKIFALAHRTMMAVLMVLVLACSDNQKEHNPYDKIPLDSLEQMALEELKTTLRKMSPGRRRELSEQIRKENEAINDTIQMYYEKLFKGIEN